MNQSIYLTVKHGTNLSSTCRNESIRPEEEKTTPSMFILTGLVY